AEEREATYQRLWTRGGAAFARAFPDLLTSKEANETAAEFVRARIRGIVKDPATARKLEPRNHPIATKRICVDTDYFETYNKDNGELIDGNEDPIVELTGEGIRTSSGLREFDSIVFATGYDAMTGSILRLDLRGRTGRTIQESWEEGP